MANREYLKVCVKQGEEKNISFKITTNNSPLYLGEYSIKFQVKAAPLEKAVPLIDKLITTTSDINTVGQINQPELGTVTVHLTKKDTSFPTGEYSLIIALVGYNYEDIISSECCNKAVYNICEQ